MTELNLFVVTTSYIEEIAIASRFTFGKGDWCGFDSDMPMEITFGKGDWCGFDPDMPMGITFSKGDWCGFDPDMPMGMLSVCMSE